MMPPMSLTTVVALQRDAFILADVMTPGRLWCINGVGGGHRSLCRFSGDLSRDWHAEAGHAVDHRAGDPGLDLLRRQSPGPEAPADQNLVPMESGFNQGPLAVTDGPLPAHSAFPGEHLDVPVALRICSQTGRAGRC